ncbi:unnamed protein product [Durusdinium trenchii]|uniref:Mercuric reductase n=1 Tax=Durusdinium trenchii TaxID=1381693 RepID=A0ABP0KFH7_9DINO
MAAPTRYDVVVVGAGSGGLTAAKTAARFGAKTMLVERLPRLGGDCTWFGCVPSKALIRCAHAFHEARSKAQLLGVEGIETEKLQCNWQKVKEHIKSCQDFIYKEDDSPEVLETAGVTVRVGCHASFLDSKTIQLTSGDTGAEPVETVFAEHFILCTGASPVLPPVKGLEDVAQAMQRFGVQVTLVGKLMPREDEDVRGVMTEIFTEEGITVVAARADSVERVEGGGLLLRAGDRELRCAALLVAAGRRPQNLEKLKLERAQVRWTKDGIPVDQKLRSNVRHIMAVGDCLGGLQFTHLAGYQGALAAFNCVQGIQVKGPSGGQVPRCTFTHPEVATVGLTFTEAVTQLGAVRVSARLRRLDHVDRAICEYETRGFIKMVVSSSGLLLGATVVAPNAGEIASELGLAVAQKLKLQAIASCIHAYPTMSFALQQLAAEDYYASLQKSRTLRCLRSMCGPRLHGAR